MSFREDLKTGKEYENYILNIIQKKYPQARLIEGYCKEYDIIIPENNKSVEVKADIDKWVETGNIAIEIRNRGELSGLSVTKADYWCHVLVLGNEIKNTLVFEVQEMKQMIKDFLNKGKAKMVMGGDDNLAQLILLPIKEVE